MNWMKQKEKKQAMKKSIHTKTKPTTNHDQKFTMMFWAGRKKSNRVKFHLTNQRFDDAFRLFFFFVSSNVLPMVCFELCHFVSNKQIFVIFCFVLLFVYLIVTKCSFRLDFNTHHITNIVAFCLHSNEEMQKFH